MIAEIEKLYGQVQSSVLLRSRVEVEKWAEVQHRDMTFPILSFRVGTDEPTAPVLFLTGGVHGLEKIGAQLAWSLLKTTFDRLLWDTLLQDLFTRVRLVVMPLLNPIGFHTNTRSNGNGVDLMRNAPVEALERPPFLVGGQRYSSRLPWYRGEENVLELENQALLRCFEKHVLKSATAISIDFHSGFGMRDRLWFPFSYTRKPFPHLAEMFSLTDLFEQAHPYHIYKIEPQTQGYMLSGDMWDYLYLKYLEENTSGVYLALTLEMGSWTWVRKNPLQIFSRHGAFNPVKEHRIKRTFRRHHLFFDFLLRALNAPSAWVTRDEELRALKGGLGIQRWFT